MINNKEEFQKFLKNFYDKVNKLHAYNPKTSYNENFRDGEKKAEEVLNFLHDVEADLPRLAYVSIGGADGSEIQYVLDNTKVKHGLLLEYDHDFCNEIRSNNVSGLTVLEGDAWINRIKCGEILNSLFEKNEIDGVIITAFSVLHELPFRAGLGYDPPILLASIIGKLPETYFYSKEPTRIFEWNSRVKISMPKYCDPSDIHKFAILMKDRFAIYHGIEFQSDIIELSDGVIMDSQLAGEVVKKFVYRIEDGNVDNLLYEIGECHTALDPVAFTNSIKFLFDKSSYDSLIQTQSITSGTFQKFYRTSGVKVDHINANSGNWVPNAFTKFEAYFRPLERRHNWIKSNSKSRVINMEENVKLPDVIVNMENSSALTENQISTKTQLLFENDFQKYFGTYQNELQFALENLYSFRKKDLMIHLDKSNAFNIAEVDWENSIQVLTYLIYKRMESLSRDKLVLIFETLYKFNDGSAVLKQILNELKKD